MSDSGEQQSLLPDQLLNSSVQRRPNNLDRHFLSINNELYNSDDNWSDSNSSCSSSYYSDCHSSSVLEWEGEISAQGELFYIESFNQPKLLEKHTTSPVLENVKENAKVTDNSTKKSTTKGKLVRLIRRRSSRRSTRKKVQESGNKDDIDVNNKSGSKVTFRETQEGESREVVLNVTAEGMSLGRRASLAESLLGLVISTFPDKSRIMIAGFVPNTQASKDKNIKVGDWLKSLNRKEIDNSNINVVLDSISPPSKVVLTLQKVAECDVTQPTPSSFQHKSRLEQSELVQQIVSGDVAVVSEVPAYWVVYITEEGVSEGGPADQGLLYCYPRHENVLTAARGAFITINHLLPQLVNTNVISSSINYKEELAHIIYTSEDKELLLIAFPNSRVSLKEANLLNASITRTLKFTCQTLSRCFSHKDNHSALDRIFSIVSTQFLSDSTMCLSRFEDFLGSANYISLPRDFQIQIDDALSELESNDFGGYNDDDDCQRLYSIIGSCLYHKGYLLASHLSKDDLLDVNAFYQHNGLLSLNRSESVKNMVVWKEVFPASCNRGLSTNNFGYYLPTGRWFLVLVGQEESALALLLESGGCTVKIEGNPGPEPIYIKQAQATLQHIRDIEVLAFADKWISNNCGVETSCPDNLFRTPFLQSTDNNPSVSDMSPKSTPSKRVGFGKFCYLLPQGPNINKKSPEVTSILKHALNLEESFTSVGSEDSVSQSASVSSVMSDEAAPILGRRAERQRANSQDRLSDSDFSDDSDWEASYKGSYQETLSGRFLDPSDLGRSLMDGIRFTSGDHNFHRLTAGQDNSLFCYVQLDSTEGVVLCSPSETTTGRLKMILDNFRSMAPMIHDLLQNTVRFKKLKVQEVSGCLINKSLIANKEHAMLFECPAGKTEGSKKSTPLTYWVVGRLFFMPQPREVYVCYQDSSPQNLVEMAFRLAMSASG